jgi:hypothetical protein
LPEPLAIHARVTQWEGRSPDGQHTVVIVFVGPHPDGCAYFTRDGEYEKPNGDRVTAFRRGDVFWRNGTSTERLTQEGHREIVRRQVEQEKTEWMREQEELRRREREQLEAGREARSLAEAPVGTMNLGLPIAELRLGVLELARAKDTIGLLWLLNDARPRAQHAIERGEIESELGDLLDKLAAIAGACIEFEQDELLTRVVGALAQIYSLPLVGDAGMRFDYSTSINPAEIGPRVFLAVLLRIYALGGLAVRLSRWGVVRQLAVERPTGLDQYWTNWLVHGLVMSSRAQHLTERRDDGSELHISLLTLATQLVEEQPTMHPDTGDGEEILTSLVQFDFLGNLAAIDEAGSTDDRSFYTNWARFRQTRIQPVADRLVSDDELRAAIVPGEDDRQLAEALLVVGRMARQEGIRYDGFWGWHTGTPVGDFISANTPPRL